MGGVVLGRMPLAVKLAMTGYLAVIGVGYLFALSQIRNMHGEMGVSVVINDYYGKPASRDSIDTYWAGIKSKALERWDQKESGNSKAEQAAVEEIKRDELDLGELDGMAYEEPDPTEQLLRSASSREDLIDRLEREYTIDLELTLGIPSISHIISMGHNHTFGHAALFVPLVVIILFSSLAPTYKSVLAAAPFVGILLDYPMVLAARLWSPFFVYLLLLGGGIMALSFTVIFFRSLYELWIGPEAKET